MTPHPGKPLRKTRLLSSLVIFMLSIAMSVASAQASELSAMTGNEVSFSFSDTDVYAAFAVLADLLEATLFVDPSVSGQVSVSVQSMPLVDAVELVAQAANVSVTLAEGVLSVTPKEAATAPATEATEMRVYSLQYAEPATVVEVAVVVAPELQLVGDDSAKRVVVRGTPAQLEEFESFLLQFDRAGRQVLLEARVEEVSREVMQELGLNWSMPTFTAEWDHLEGSLPVAMSKLSATLDALETQGNARLLARPTITAVSGEKATIFVGDRVPIVLKGGEKGDDRVEFIEAGINLDIVARVGDDGLITTHVKPQVSSIVTWTPQGMPQIRSRNAETTVRVRDGQPIVIGGLIREEDREVMSQVSGLNALPVVGALFRSKRHDSTQFETVIILTPRLLPASDDAGPASPSEHGDRDSDAARLHTPAGAFQPKKIHARIGVDTLAPAPGRTELSLAQTNQASRAHWEAKALLPFPPTSAGEWRYGVAWRMHQRPLWLQVAVYGVSGYPPPFPKPTWEVELAAGATLTDQSGPFVEPCVRAVWSIGKETSPEPASVSMGLLLGLQL